MINFLLLGLALNFLSVIFFITLIKVGTHSPIDLIKKRNTWSLLFMPTILIPYLMFIGIVLTLALMIYCDFDPKRILETLEKLKRWSNEKHAKK
jgi:hypothetical protein